MVVVGGGGFQTLGLVAGDGAIDDPACVLGGRGPGRHGCDGGPDYLLDLGPGQALLRQVRPLLPHYLLDVGAGQPVPPTAGGEEQRAQDGQGRSRPARASSPSGRFPSSSPGLGIGYIPPMYRQCRCQPSAPAGGCPCPGRLGAVVVPRVTHSPLRVAMAVISGEGKCREVIARHARVILVGTAYGRSRGPAPLRPTARHRRRRLMPAAARAINKLNRKGVVLFNMVVFLSIVCVLGSPATRRPWGWCSRP